MTITLTSSPPGTAMLIGAGGPASGSVLAFPLPGGQGKCFRNAAGDQYTLYVEVNAEARIAAFGGWAPHEPALAKALDPAYQQASTYLAVGLLKALEAGHFSDKAMDLELSLPAMPEMDEARRQWWSQGLARIGCTCQFRDGTTTACTVSGQLTPAQLLREVATALALMDPGAGSHCDQESLQELLEPARPWVDTMPSELGWQWNRQWAMGQDPLLNEIATRTVPGIPLHYQDAATDRLRDEAVDTVLQALLPSLQEAQQQGHAHRIADLNPQPGDCYAAWIKALAPAALTLMHPELAILQQLANRLGQSGLSQEELAPLALYRGAALFEDSRLAGTQIYLLPQLIQHLESDRCLQLLRALAEQEATRHIALTAFLDPAKGTQIPEWLPRTGLRQRWDQQRFHIWMLQTATALGMEAKLIPHSQDQHIALCWMTKA